MFFSGIGRLDWCDLNVHAVWRGPPAIGVVPLPEAELDRPRAMHERWQMPGHCQPN